MNHKKFDTFLEMNDYLLEENEHERNRFIVKNQTFIIEKIPDGQRIVEQAKEYCKDVLNIPDQFLTTEYHEQK